jgi:hypothetical protein
MRWWLCFSIVLAACSKHEEVKPSTSGTGSGSAVVQPVSHNVELYVDDAQVGTVAPPHVATWPRLDTLVPVAARRLGTWQVVYLKGKTEKPSELQNPSGTYPDLVPALFPGEDGSPAFGMFDPVELAKHGKPQLREDGIREVRIKLSQGGGRGEHEQGSGGGADPTAIEITIKTPTGQSKVTGKQLLDIPRQPFPGETGEGRGWTVQTILDAAGVKKFDKLLLTDAAGMNLNLDRSDFDPKKSVPFVKLNRQGSLRLRIFYKDKESDAAWQQRGDLRGLVGIQVLK